MLPTQNAATILKPLVPNPFYTWCNMLLTGLHHSLVVGIPLFLPSNSSILPLYFLPLLSSLTFTRVGGDHNDITSNGSDFPFRKCIDLSSSLNGVFYRKKDPKKFYMVFLGIRRPFRLILGHPVTVELYAYSYLCRYSSTVPIYSESLMTKLVYTIISTIIEIIPT